MILNKNNMILNKNNKYENNIKYVINKCKLCYLILLIIYTKT